jgi:hypothetical protein
MNTLAADLCAWLQTLPEGTRVIVWGTTSDDGSGNVEAILPDGNSRSFRIAEGYTSLGVAS